jgi:hypothetical protein
MQTQIPIQFGKAYILGEKGIEFQNKYNELRNKYGFLIKENNKFLQEYSKVNRHKCFSKAFQELFYAYQNKDILDQDIVSISKTASPLHKLLFDAPQPKVNKIAQMSYSVKFLTPKPYSRTLVPLSNKEMNPSQSFKNFKRYLTIK